MTRCPINYPRVVLVSTSGGLRLVISAVDEELGAAHCGGHGPRCCYGESCEYRDLRPPRGKSRRPPQLVNYSVCRQAGSGHSVYTRKYGSTLLVPVRVAKSSAMLASMRPELIVAGIPIDAMHAVN
jgi:hypothetical protein